MEKSVILQNWVSPFKLGNFYMPTSVSNGGARYFIWGNMDNKPIVAVNPLMKNLNHLKEKKK